MEFRNGKGWKIRSGFIEGELGSEGIWICKGRGISGYEVERQRYELDSGHFGR